MDRIWAMQIFVRVAEAGSFSRAAVQLGLSNASVTAAVRNLEAHLGVTLLQRSTRVSSLTEEGERFLEGARRVLATMSDVESSVAEMSGSVSGQLRIEAPFALGHVLLGPLLADFSAAHPQLLVHCTLTNIPQNLIQEGTDVSVRMDEVTDADLVARRLLTADYVAMASPAFVQAHRIGEAPDSLPPELCLGLISPTVKGVRLWEFRNGERSHSIAPAGRLALNSSDALIQAAIRGAGAIYVLNLLARPYLASGLLVPLFAGWQTARRTFYGVYRKTQFMPRKIRVFVDFLTAAMAPYDRDAPAEARSRSRSP
jgi:LysR family transcriptional regulator for bpeEF and oprC